MKESRVREFSFTLFSFINIVFYGTKICHFGTNECLLLKYAVPLQPDKHNNTFTYDKVKHQHQQGSHHT